MPTDVASDPRRSMAALHRAPEPEVLKPLLERAWLTPESRKRVMGHALALLADLRAAQNRGWVNQFLQEYRLNSSEGVALLSLAEAFLRVPDPETADLLIADKLGDADWRSARRQVQLDAGQFGDLGAGDRPRAGRRRAGGDASPPDRARGRAVRPPGGRRGDEADGRGLRDGPHHRRSVPAG